MRGRYALWAVGALLLMARATQAAPDTASLKLTNKACAGEGVPLTLNAKAQVVLVDASGLKISESPKELLIMRKPVNFFRIPWVLGKTSYEISAATAKPVFGHDALFPLRPGEKLTIAVMSAKDDVILSCDTEVR